MVDDAQMVMAGLWASEHCQPDGAQNPMGRGLSCGPFTDPNSRRIDALYRTLSFRFRRSIYQEPFGINGSHNN